MTDAPKLPCEECPVVCICMTKFDIDYPYNSVDKLRRNCAILKNWLIITKSNNYTSFYSKGALKIRKHFRSLKGYS